MEEQFEGANSYQWSLVNSSEHTGEVHRRTVIDLEEELCGFGGAMHGRYACFVGESGSQDRLAPNSGRLSKELKRAYS